jgi:hypothetical protein
MKGFQSNIWVRISKLLRYDAWAQVRENRNAHMVLIVEPGGKILVRSCCKWDYTTKLYLKEGFRVWLGFIWLSTVPNVLAVVNTMNIRVT